MDLSSLDPATLQTIGQWSPSQFQQFQASLQGPNQAGGANAFGSGAAPGAGGNIFGNKDQTGLNTGFGMNIGTGQLALSGLSTLGNLWTSWNAQQLAQQSFDFNKTLSSDNYANQAQAYNTQLGNIESERASMTNQTPAQAAAYVQQHSVKTTV